MQTTSSILIAEKILWEGYENHYRMKYQDILVYVLHQLPKARMLLP